MLTDENTDWHIIYKAMIHAIKTNSGIGFHNCDQGHPAYVLGADGGDSSTMGDSPEKNLLYQMVKDLSWEHGEDAGQVINDWQDFCKLAVESYKKDKDSNG